MVRLRLLITLLCLTGTLLSATAAIAQDPDRLPYRISVELETPDDEVLDNRLHIQAVRVAVTCTGVLPEPTLELQVPIAHTIDGAAWYQNRPDRTLTFTAAECLDGRTQVYFPNVAIPIDENAGTTHTIRVTVSAEADEATGRWNLTTRTITGPLDVWAYDVPRHPPQAGRPIHFGIGIRNHNNQPLELTWTTGLAAGASLHVALPDSIGPGAVEFVPALYEPGNATGWCCFGDHILHNVSVMVDYHHPILDATQEGGDAFLLFYEPIRPAEPRLVTEEASSLVDGWLLALLLGTAWSARVRTRSRPHTPSPPTPPRTDRAPPQ